MLNQKTQMVGRGTLMVWRWCGFGGNVLFTGLFQYDLCWCVLFLPPVLDIQNIVMIVLGVSVVVASGIALIFYR